MTPPETDPPSHNETTDGEPTDGGNPKRSSTRTTLGILFLAVFIDLLGFGIVLPLLPRYGKFYGADGLTLGLLMASFSAMQFFFAPAWGWLSDRIGRRPVLLVGLTGSAIFYTAFGFASRLPADETFVGLTALTWLFITRIGAGIAGATISTAQACIADTTDESGRGKGMALIGAAFGAGFTFGPLIGAPFVASGLEGAPSPWPGWIAGGLSAFALIFAAVKLPETLHRESRSAVKAVWWDVSRFGRMFGRPVVGLVLATIFLSVLAFAQLESILALLTADLNYSDRGNFYVFAYVGFVLSLSQGMFVRRLLPRIGNRRGALLGLVLLIVGLGLTGAVAITTTTWLLFPVLAVSVIGFSITNPALQALLSLNASGNEQGETLGLGQSVAAMARILGPAIGILLYESIDPGLPFWIASGCLLCCLVIFGVGVRPEPMLMADAGSGETPSASTPTTEPVSS